MIPIVTFDVLESEWTTEKILEFDYDNQEILAEKYITKQMQSLDYETNNSIIILGSLGVFSFVCYVLMILFGLLYFLMYILRKMELFNHNQTLQDWKKHLFFKQIIQISVGGYFEILISGYLNIMEPLSSSNGEVIANVVAWYCLIVTLLLIPLAWFNILKRPIAEINKEKFKDVWGEFYNNIKTKQKVTLIYYFIFCVRRVLFCMTALFMSRYEGIQIQILAYFNLIIIMY